MLLEFVNENNRIPKCEEIYKGVKLGQFWSGIKQNNKNKLYKNYFEKNEILRKDYERAQSNKKENEGKEIITPEQKCNLLLEFINLENRLPVKSEIYKGVTLGNFFDHIKQGDHKLLYKNYIDKNKMAKEAYEKVNQMKEEKKGKEIITPDQKSFMLLEFVNENNRIPKCEEIYKGVKLGQFWSSLKQNNKNKLYKNYLDKNKMLKEDYEKVNQMKEEKKGKEIITPDQKSFMLLEFVNVEKRVPIVIEIYKGVKLGKFWDGIRHGKSYILYKKYFEKNEILRKDYERVQSNKKGKEVFQ
jgi:hypothetical protein